MTQEVAIYEAGPVAPVTHSALVMPVATANEMREATRAYEALKSAILRPRDVQKISGQDHIKKSGWLRIARAFGVSAVVIRSELMVDAASNDWGYLVIVQATAPNGAHMTGDGMCWKSEKTAKNIPATRHNVHAHAATRAMNRAISNLVGGGEVSAEELSDYVDSEPQSAPVRALPAHRPAPHAAKSSPAEQADAVYGTGATIQKLRRRIYNLGARTEEMADDLCQEALGKTWHSVTEADAPALEAWIARREREQAEEAQAPA